MALLSVRVLTPKRPLFEGQARAVTLQSSEGELTLLPNHAHLVASLGIGVATIVTDDGAPEELFVARGTLECHRDRVLVLAHSAQHVADIDFARAEEELAAAETRLRQISEVDSDTYRRQRERLARAQARLRARAQ